MVGARRACAVVIACGAGDEMVLTSVPTGRRHRLRRRPDRWQSGHSPRKTISAEPSRNPRSAPLGTGQLGEVGDQVPDAAAPLAHQVVVRVLDVGVESGPARAHVERDDLAELGEVVERLVHRLERDGLHLPRGQGVDRLGRRVGLVALEDPEDALPLGGDLPAGRAEQLGQLLWRPHTPQYIANDCFSTIIVEKARRCRQVVTAVDRSACRTAGRRSDVSRRCGRLGPMPERDGARGAEPSPGRFRRDEALGPPPRRDLRRARRRRGHHRCRGGPRRRQPGPAHRPGGEGRLRLGDLVQVVEARPRRPPLPPTARVPARLREPGRAPAAHRERPAPGLTPSPSSSPSSAGPGWSTAAWPAPTGRPSGSTT